MDIAMGFINERKNTVSIREEYGGIGMAPEEAIELLKGMQSPLEDYAELVGAPAFAYGHKYVYPYPQDYAIEEAIEALKEIQQYREIGTVEECREAREKQIPKKPVCKPKPYNESVGFNEEWFCPYCGTYIGYFYEGMDEPEQMEYCNECGQHIARDWSDENEDE